MYSIKNIRLSDQVIEAVKKMIPEQKFAPGDKFYSENELTKILGVSRSSIREAVRILEATGYVTVRQGRGIFIAESFQHELDAFRGWLNNNKEAVFDHYEVRMIIDPKAASSAAEKAGPAEIERLELICSEFDEALKAESNAALIKADEMFHLFLAKSSGNRTLFFIMDTMTKALHDGWISSLHISSRAEATSAEHRKILAAVSSGNSRDAELAMSEHLNNAIVDISKAIDKE